MTHLRVLGVVLGLVGVLVVVGVVLESSACPRATACEYQALQRLVPTATATLASTYQAAYATLASSREADAGALAEPRVLFVMGLVLMGLGVVGRHLLKTWASRERVSRSPAGPRPPRPAGRAIPD